MPLLAPVLLQLHAALSAPVENNSPPVADTEASGINAAAADPTLPATLAQQQQQQQQQQLDAFVKACHDVLFVSALDGDNVLLENSVVVETEHLSEEQQGLIKCFQKSLADANVCPVFLLLFLRITETIIFERRLCVRPMHGYRQSAAS